MYDRYSIVDLFGPVRGEGWAAPEIRGGVSFRRMDGPVSSLMIPTMGALSLRIFVVFAAADGPAGGWEDAALSFDDRPVQTLGGEGAGGAAAWFDLWLGERRPTGRLQIASPAPLAVSRVEIFSRAADVAAEPLERTQTAMRDLSKTLAERERSLAEARADLQAMRASTFWRATAPLRRLVSLVRS